MDAVVLDAHHLLHDVVGSAAPLRPATLYVRATSPSRLPPRPTRKGSGRTHARDDLLTRYLASIGRAKLLSPEEERALAQRLWEVELRCFRALLAISAGRAQVFGHPLILELPEAERTALAALSDADAAERLREIDGDRALLSAVCVQTKAFSSSSQKEGSIAPLFREVLAVRNRFVRANLRLVVSVARRFRHHTMPLLDLIQEGNLGLIKSVHRFDHRRGFRFSTYAHWWIRQAIERAIMNKGSQVRLPVHLFDARREVARATRDLQRKLGREPSLDELAQELLTDVTRLHEIMRHVPREPQSLDEPAGEDDRSLGEVISDQESLTPDEHVMAAEDARWVRRMLSRLSPMEMDILRRRYGMDGRDDETLEDIGKSYALSRERVRQLQMQGQQKIAQHARVRESGFHLG